jgi:DNA-directed RNA polymerase subunit beta
VSLNLSKKRIRYSFSRHDSSKAIIPNLIKIQYKSYENFLQLTTPIKNRKNRGLENVLRSVFDINDPEGKLKLEYMSYSISEPKHEPNECIHRGVNYAGSLKVMLRLILWNSSSLNSNENKKINESIKGIQEQEVYFGEIPLMTDMGTFIINGAQRVIVSQLHRSPGVFYTHDNGKTSSVGKLIYSARIIPYRGSWFDFEFDVKDLLYFRIDRKRKLPVSTLLRALGLNTAKIISTFYNKKNYLYKAKQTNQ